MSAFTLSGLKGIRSTSELKVRDLKEYCEGGTLRGTAVVKLKRVFCGRTGRMRGRNNLIVSTIQ